MHHCHHSHHHFSTTHIGQKVVCVCVFVAGDGRRYLIFICLFYQIPSLSNMYITFWQRRRKRDQVFEKVDDLIGVGRFLKRNVKNEWEKLVFFCYYYCWGYFAASSINATENEKKFPQYLSSLWAFFYSNKKEREVKWSKWIKWNAESCKMEKKEIERERER